MRICNEIGYPVMLKASMGGGGKGMRLIHNESEVVEAYNTARSESMSSFGYDTVYLEKFVEEPHHIEFQILATTTATSSTSSTANAPCNAATRRW